MQQFAQQFLEFVRSIEPNSRLRLAPTPSGFLHIGNALNFILNWLAAQSCGGLACGKSPAKIFLRIDNLDSDRKRQEYVDDLFESLNWLGLSWDGEPVYQSSESRSQLYEQVLSDLRDRNLLFACRKSRRDLEPFAGKYPLEFRDQGLSLDADDIAWRIKTPPEFPLPDFVVRRRDSIPAYQVASFADDLEMGITHIVRGDDLQDSTAAQQFLARSLSAEAFVSINFFHHPLLLDESGRKLSKSEDARSLKSLRASGAGPEMVYQITGTWLGLEGNSGESLLVSLRALL